MKKGSGRRSLSVRMMISMGGLILGICLFFGLSTSSLATKILKESIDESMLEIVDEAADSVYLKVMDEFNILETLVSYDGFFDVNNEQNKEIIKDLLSDFEKKNNILNMIVTDKSGNGYSLKAENVDISDQDFFKNAVKGKNVVTDPIELDGPLKIEGHNDFVTIYSIPIWNDSKEIVGTISSICDGYELCDFISDIEYATSGYAYIINKQGKSIAHSTDKSLIMGASITERAKTEEGLSQLAEIEQKMINGEQGLGEYVYENVTKYMSYTPIGDLNWSLALTAPENEVMAGVTDLNLQTVNVSIAFFLIGITVAAIFSRNISKPIKTAAGLAYNLAKGDFTQDLPEKLLKRRDEIGLLADSFKQLNEGMNELLASIRVASDQVATGAKQISDSSMLLSQGATEQASSLEELTASIEEISTQTKFNAENADNANRIAIQTKTLANEGNEQMNEMLGAMEKINTSSNNISKIIKVIDDIAFQTNILALNAAVEAARAGQAGKGFAVVAQEVRKLAAKSAAAAKETTELIESSIVKVNDGTKIAKETAEHLNKIVDGISKAAEIVNSISVASNEQASAISQINQGIMQVSQVVQENSSTSEEGAAASEELSGQAAMLKEQIAKFKLKDGNHIDLNQKKEKTEPTVPEPKNDQTDIKISLSDKNFGKY